MALTKLEENLNIIENLSDSPTLESDELKRKFDEGSLVIKNYLNEVLTKEIDDIVTQIKKDVNAKLLEDNKKKYYVGKLIFDTKNVNPATYLGFGTWQLWGSGRVPVGVDTSNGNFNVVEKTGGSSTINISHTHTIQGHTHTTAGHVLNINEIPSHGHGIKTYADTVGSGGSVTGRQVRGTEYAHVVKLSRDGTEKAGGGQAHSHGNTGSTALKTDAGGSTNVSNLQPYITCYIWKRIS